MSIQLHTRLTPEEYLRLERQAPFKSEYLAGDVFALAGANRRHNQIAANIIRVLGNQLVDRPCSVYPSDMRVKMPAISKYTYPDILVVCGEELFEDAENDTLLNPTVIIEVLSQSTEAYDRGAKFEHYQSIESLLEYVLVSQQPFRVEQFVRKGQRAWSYYDFRESTDTVQLSSVACQPALKEIYHKV